MKATNRIEIIVAGLIRKFSNNLTETEKLSKVNEELKKMDKNTISRSTYYNYKRKSPKVFISNKDAEKRAKQQPRTDYQKIKEECIKILSKREKISINKSKSFVQSVVEEEGDSSKRRRTRVNFNYVISEIHHESSVDHLLIGFEELK